jgi:two-component sensor histidine kinase
MALNELATNATKHGALSSGSGTVSLVWELREAKGRTELDLLWKEADGPTVQAPTRRGFGTRLMERSIEGDLSGEFDLVFDPKGLSCRIVFPLRGPLPHG